MLPRPASSGRRRSLRFWLRRPGRIFRKFMFLGHGFRLRALPPLGPSHPCTDAVYMPTIFLTRWLLVQYEPIRSPGKGVASLIAKQPRLHFRAWPVVRWSARLMSLPIVYRSRICQSTHFFGTMSAGLLPVASDHPRGWDPSFYFGEAVG